MLGDVIQSRLETTYYAEWAHNYDATAWLGGEMIHESAFVEQDVVIGSDVRVWGGSHIRQGAQIGSGTVIGEGVYVGTGVKVGENCKIQNNALVYEPAELKKGVFIGPAAILTNDQYPRAVNPDLSLKNANDWAPVGVTIEEGASIGAGAICVAPLKIGRWALVAAGSTVTNEVLDFELVAGTPARRIGWVGKSGRRLKQVDNDLFECPLSQERYVLVSGRLVPVSQK